MPAAQHKARRGAPDETQRPTLRNRAPQAQHGGPGTPGHLPGLHGASSRRGPPELTARHLHQEVPLAVGQGKSRD